MCTGTHPYIPVPETAEARLTFSTPGGVAQNVYNFRKAGGWQTSDLEALGLALKTWWSTELQLSCSNTVALESITLTDIATETGKQLVYTDGLPLTGGAGQQALPPNVVACISWLTDYRGRSFRGRTYHVGLTVVGVTTSFLTAAYRLTLEAAYQALRDNTYTDPLVRLAIVSRCFDGFWRAIGVATEVTSHKVDLPLDSQRRRLAGRGQ